MDNEHVSRTDAPHASDHVDQMISAQVDKKSVEARVGEIFDRSFGMSGEPDSKREAREQSRPVSDPAPHGFDDELDAEDKRTDDEKLEGELDRIFGTDDDLKRATPPTQQKSEPSAAPQPPDEEALSANIFSWEESQHIARFEGERQQLLTAADRHRQEAQLIEQIQDPQRKQAAKLWHLQKEAALRKHAEALVRAGDDIYQTAKSRQENQLLRRRSSEMQKLRSAFPDYDSERARAYLKSYQYDDTLINSLQDHRVLVLAEKARLYDDMKRQQKPRQIRKVTRVERARDDRAKLQRAQRSGNYDSAADALDRRLSEIFR